MTGTGAGGDRRGTHRRLIVLLVALLATLGGMTGSAAALEIPAEVVIRSVALPNPPVDRDRCVAYAFQRFPDVPNATRYEGVAEGFNGANDVTFSGPPFPDDEFTWGDAVFRVEPGYHWFALGGFSTGRGCTEAEAGVQGRFAVLFMRADFEVIGNDPPVAVATLTRDPANPNRVTVSAAGSFDDDGGIVSYSWSFGDGATASGLNAERTYTSGGRRTVTLTVTDTDGAIDTATAIADIPFRVSGRLTERRCPPGGACRVVGVTGATVRASGASTETATANASGAWTMLLTQGAWRITPVRPSGQSAWAPVARTPTVSANLSGQDFQRCAVGANRPPTGCGSPTATFTSGVSNDPRDVTFDPAGSTDPDGRLVRFDWDFGDGETARRTGPARVTHRWTTPGTKTVTLTVTDDQGDQATIRRTVRTFHLPLNVVHIDDERPVPGVQLIYARGSIAGGGRLDTAGARIGVRMNAAGAASVVLPEGRYVVFGEDERRFPSIQGVRLPGTSRVTMIYSDYVDLYVAALPPSIFPQTAIIGVRVRVTGRATRGRTVDETIRSGALGAFFGVPPSAGGGYTIRASCGPISVTRAGVRVPEDPARFTIHMRLNLRPLGGDPTVCRR